MREKQAQQELVVLRGKLATEEAALERLVAEEAALAERLVTIPGQALDLQDRLFTENAIQRKRQEQRDQQGRIDQAGQAVRDQQAVVTQRGVEVKALEKLREKQVEEHRLDQLREEGIFLDDLAGQGFLRRRTQERQRNADAAS